MLPLIVMGTVRFDIDVYFFFLIYYVQFHFSRIENVLYFLIDTRICMNYSVRPSRQHIVVFVYKSNILFSLLKCFIQTDYKLQTNFFMSIFKETSPMNFLMLTINSTLIFVENNFLLLKNIIFLKSCPQFNFLK